VIDWCIFSFLRDKLIQYHSSDPALDEICGDIGLSYVVQADLSELVAGAAPLTVYFNIRGIISRMENSPPWSSDQKAQEEAEAEARLPAPDLYTLLHTKEYARELYRHLNIANGTDGYLVDPCLFARYPHLYEANPKVAHGTPLRSSNKLEWPTPQALGDTAMSCYRKCVSSA
jgi:hypothetical protein